jgi:hypothetical protein
VAKKLSATALSSASPTVPIEATSTDGQAVAEGVRGVLLGFKGSITDVVARCCTSGLLQGVVTPREPCTFVVRHPAVGRGLLTCEGMTGCEYISVDPG